jgi:DNA-binding GntR family transcriptional regulator
MARTDDRFRVAYNALLDLCAGLGSDGALPSENALAAQIGVSRTVVRAGLRRLDDARIIRWDGRAKTLLRPPGPADRLIPADDRPDALDLEDRFFDWVVRFDVPVGATLNVARLARDFGAAPQMVQEFLAGLARFGLVERRPRGGWRMLGFTPDFAVELSEFRTVLELNAIERLIETPPSHPIWAELASLRADHQDLKARVATDYDQFPRLDERFHDALNSVVANRFVVESQKAIKLIFHYHYQWDKTDEPTRNAAAIDEHLALIDALLVRDPERARSAARRHLATARATLLSSMRDHRLG